MALSIRKRVYEGVYILEAFLIKFIGWMVNSIGYVTVIKLKDILLFCAGIALGELLMVVCISRFFHKVQKVEREGKTTSIQFRHNGEMRYFTSLSTLYQSMEFIMGVAFMPFRHKDSYVLEDKNRTRKFVICMLLIIGVLVLIGIILVLNPILLPDKL